MRKEETHHNVRAGSCLFVVKILFLPLRICERFSGITRKCAEFYGIPEAAQRKL